MHGKELKLDALRSGDLLLLEDMGELSHLGIAATQALFSHHSKASANVTHVGLYDRDDKRLCEASGAAGLRQYPLAQKHEGYKFQVYRYQDEPIANEATRIANALVQLKLDAQAQNAKSDLGVYTEKGGDSYDTKGAYTGATIRNSVFGPGARAAIQALHEQYDQNRLSNPRFYCSSFVIACYQLAELSTGATPETIQSIQLDYRFTTPKTLQGLLRQDEGPIRWLYAGNYVSGRPGAPRAETNLWLPEQFDAQTWHYGKRPDALHDIHFMLENYHGIPLDAQNTGNRRQLLQQIATATEQALADSEINVARKDGLRDFLTLVQHEIWDTEQLDTFE